MSKKGRFDLWDQWVNFTTEDSQTDNRIHFLLEDRAGHIWCGTLGGVSRYDGERWQSFTTADGLAHKSLG